MQVKTIFAFVIFCLLPVSFYGQEIHVRRGSAADFPATFQGTREGDGLYFGMSDLPPGRIIQLTRPELVTAGQPRITGQVLIVKQIPNEGRLRSSMVVLSPAGSDYFGVRSELFLIASTSSARWADDVPTVPKPSNPFPDSSERNSKDDLTMLPVPFGTRSNDKDALPLPPQPPQMPQPTASMAQPQEPAPSCDQNANKPAIAKFRKSTVEEYDYKMLGDGSIEYNLEPAEARPPAKTRLADAVDEFEKPSSKKQDIDYIEQEPQKFEIDVNVAAPSPNNTVKEPKTAPAPVIQTPAPPIMPAPSTPSCCSDPYGTLDPALKSRLCAKTLSALPPGCYMQIGVFCHQENMIRAFLTAEKCFDVYIIPVMGPCGTCYRVVVGPFGNHELGIAHSNLKKLGFGDAFVVRR